MKLKSYIKQYFPVIAKWGRIGINYTKYLIHRTSIKYHSNFPVTFIKVKGFKNSFFGYYDKTPFNPKDENLVIFHVNNYSIRKIPNPDVATGICIFDLKDKSFDVLDFTYSWNWQQGARLHWINSEEVIYNFYDKKEKKVKAKRLNVYSGKYIIYELPVQETFGDKFFLNLDYLILKSIRPDYCYRNRCSFMEKNVYLTDFSTGKRELIIDIQDLIRKFIGSYSQKIIKGKINHIMISPNGDKFIFLFRYFLKGERKHMLFLYELNKRKLFLLLKESIISHYCWLNNNEIFFWGIIDGKSGYYCMDIGNKLRPKFIFSLPDGHPSLIKGNLILTDTYPNKSRLRKLLILNLTTKEIEEIASFFESPILYGECRCDLHPHVSSMLKYIHCDTAIFGYRALALLEVNI